MMTFSDKKEQKNQIIYLCNNCDYNTFKRCNYEKHLQTLKHKKRLDSDKIVTNSDKKVAKVAKVANSRFNCICGKQYKYRQGLSLHKK
tara:strand:- start:635 stop:898 length:264 start_codon:yes stop_codon:yes gene_type:complete